MEFSVPPLPYEKDALAPAMAAETLEFHYEKHHKGYMVKLEGLLKGKPEADMSLEEVVKTSSGPVFNNAAQIWNHTFWWNSLKPNGGGAPPAGDVGDLIAKLGGWDKFREDFIAAGNGRFGSGWVWLVLSGGVPKIISTANADTPLTTGDVPLLTADVWEHAYYIDHRNNRNAFLEVVADKLINWDFVAKNLQSAK